MGYCSQLADCHSIPWFYKPTIPQYPPSHLQDYSTCNSARLIFCPTLSFHALIQVNGAWKMVSVVVLGFERTTFQSWVFCLIFSLINLLFVDVSKDVIKDGVLTRLLLLTLIQVNGDWKMVSSVGIRTHLTTRPRRLAP